MNETQRALCANHATEWVQNRTRVLFECRVQGMCEYRGAAKPTAQELMRRARLAAHTSYGSKATPPHAYLHHKVLRQEVVQALGVEGAARAVHERRDAVLRRLRRQLVALLQRRQPPRRGPRALQAEAACRAHTPPHSISVFGLSVMRFTAEAARARAAWPTRQYSLACAQ